MSDLQRAMYDLLSADGAERRDELEPNAYVRFWTGQDGLKLWSPATDTTPPKFSDRDLEHGTLSITVPGTVTWDEYFDELPRYMSRLVSVDMPGGYRVAYWVTSAVRVPAGDTHAWDVTGVSVSRYLDFPLWPDPLLPAELQISGTYKGIGPAVTVAKTALALNLTRLQAELWSVPVTNPFSPATWDILAKAMNPVIVNPRRTGIADTSDWVTTEWCMDSAWDAVVEVCQAAELSPRVDLWLPGDPQPFPEFLHLTEPRLVVDIVPSARQVQFTGTVLDGAIRKAIKIADDAWDWLTYPFLSPEGSILEDLEGDPLKMGIPVYRSGQWSPITDATRTITYPTSSRSTVGGKSPDWVNTIVADGLGVAVSAIGSAVGLPGLRLGFLEKMAENRILAYHSIEDRALAAEAGRWRMRESFAGSQTTALTLQAAEAAKSDRWANRGRVSRQVTVVNGSPYFVGRHLRVGRPVAIEHDDGTATVETVAGIDHDGNGPVTVSLSHPEPSEPGAYALGETRKVAGWVNRLATA